MKMVSVRNNQNHLIISESMLKTDIGFNAHMTKKKTTHTPNEYTSKLAVQNTQMKQTTEIQQTHTHIKPYNALIVKCKHQQKQKDSDTGTQCHGNKLDKNRLKRNGTCRILNKKRITHITAKINVLSAQNCDVYIHSIELDIFRIYIYIYIGFVCFQAALTLSIKIEYEMNCNACEHSVVKL